MGPEKKETKKDKKEVAQKPKATAAAAPAKAPRAPKPTVQAAPKVVVEDKRNPLQKRREITGIVISDKMQKTIVVKITRSVRHAFYKKYIDRTMKFKAHDEKNVAKMGDLVTLVESRPLSRHKRWVLQTVVRKAEQTPEANV